MQIDGSWLEKRAMTLIPLWLSLSVHEWAHAWTAWRLGDDTAKQLGRMTINPLAHLDLVGTVLFPLMGIPFGWAKPVPVQPHRFREGVNMRMGMMLVSIAGPLANLGLAALSLGLLALVSVLKLAPSPILNALAVFLYMMILINVMLAVFNALPIPPLDGSRVVDVIVPDGLRGVWDSLRRLGPLALAMVLILPALHGTSLFHWPYAATQWTIHQVLSLTR
jgi:Zn-dependent protease